MLPVSECFPCHAAHPIRGWIHRACVLQLQSLAPTASLAHCPTTGGPEATLHGSASFPWTGGRLPSPLGNIPFHASTLVTSPCNTRPDAVRVLRNRSQARSPKLPGWRKWTSRWVKDPMCPCAKPTSLDSRMRSPEKHRQTVATRPVAETQGSPPQPCAEAPCASWPKPPETSGLAVFSWPAPHWSSQACPWYVCPLAASGGQSGLSPSLDPVFGAAPLPIEPEPSDLIYSTLISSHFNWFKAIFFNSSVMSISILCV